MWGRFRRWSLAPRRPLLFREQVPLALVSVVFLAVGVVAVVVLLVQHG
jgi:hypothetical protein